MSIKVAVRVRPFNAAEMKDENCYLCIDMKNETTIIKDASGSTKSFTFDYSFWSHDQFKETPEGSIPLSEKYADQKKVFETLGILVLENAWNGYHCCLFAYGQTGSGKSYSMIGYEANKGIVPLACNEIFKRIDSTSAPNKQFQVSISMLEIYNEKIQDLLMDAESRPSGGLKVRESQKIGVFVENLTKHVVKSYSDIEEKMEIGKKNRTIGETLMNKTSSRAHTIINIEFKQIDFINGKTVEKFSVINLVDLAGSERAEKTEAKGIRLKEGSSINKSLTVLGQVINTLAEKSIGKAAKQVVPYRDSVLTRILQNALGGNSKTIMICAISPASTNYEESLSTLRYAERAKKIQNKAVINEDPQDKMIRELKEENERLKTELENIYSNKKSEENIPKINELTEEIDANKIAIDNMSKTWEEKVEETKRLTIRIQKPSIDFSLPYISNLSEDSQLNATIIYSLSKIEMIVGRLQGEPKPDIILGGFGIRPLHAKFVKNSNNNVYLNPISSECSDYLFINGKKVVSSSLLTNNDRIIFGTHLTFLFKHLNLSENKNVKEYDWEDAQQEMLAEIKKERETQNLENQKIKSEFENSIRSLEEKQKDEKDQLKIQYVQMKNDYEKKVKELENQNNERSSEKILENEIDKLNQSINAMNKKISDLNDKHEKSLNMLKSFYENQLNEKKEIEKKICKIYPKVRDITLCTAEMGRSNILFRVKPIFVINENSVEDTPLTKFKTRKVEILLEVRNEEIGEVYYWDENKLSSRLDSMQYIYNLFMNSQLIKAPELSQDPLVDQVEPILIGYAFYLLRPIWEGIESSNLITVISNFNNGKIGEILVKSIPFASSTIFGESSNLEDEKEIQKSDKLYKDIEKNFCIIIEEGFNFTQEFSNIYCQYNFYLDEQSCIANAKEYKNGKILFGYKSVHKIEQMTEKIVNYLQNNSLMIKLFGIPIANKKGGSKEYKNYSKINILKIEEFELDKNENKNENKNTDRENSIPQKENKCNCV